jgi:cytochrome c553
MKPVVKRILLGAGAVVLTAAAALGVYVVVQTSAFDASLDKVYDVPVPEVTRATDAATLARGEHLAKAVGACTNGNCHGADLGGGKPIVMGPLATFEGPNITASGLGGSYTDGELVRLIRHGLKRDGRSVRFMPSQDFGWMSQDDVVALVSWLRTVPPVGRVTSPSQVKLLGKVLDRRGSIPIDVARRIDHAQRDTPTATVEKGAALAQLCTGCHGEHLSGGRPAGAPASMPVPLNLTPHETGLADWTYDDFDRLMKTGIRKNGARLNPFMNIESFSQWDDGEKHAVWAYLRSLPPTPLGNR